MSRSLAAVFSALLLCTDLAAQSAQPLAGVGGDAGFPASWTGPGPQHKLIVDAAEGDLAAALRAGASVRREIDYGAFTLFLVDESAFGGRDALIGAALPVHDEQDLIPANGWYLDGTHPQLTLAQLPPDLRFGDGSGAVLDLQAGLFLVQMQGPMLDRWHDALLAAGARIVQYLPMNAYVVAADPVVARTLLALRDAEDGVQYVGEWQPAFRLTPAIRAASDAGGETSVPATVQLVRSGDTTDPAADALLASLAAAGATIGLSTAVGPYLNVEADLPPFVLVPLAWQPQVFNIELRGTRKRFDERQGQISAGNVVGSSVGAPGYLNWLIGKGFSSSQFGSFSVNVADDATSLTGHPDLPSARVAFTQNPTNETGQQGGHGFLNANIVAGNNDLSGAPNTDAAGHHYGLGIAPWSLVGSTAIFGPGTFSPPAYESTAYSLGARISSNSWGFTNGGFSPIADYDSNSQAYDGMVRDARPSQGGNQEYVVVFAASNFGPSSNTVASPGTAKNVITVGASENDRQTGTDGCSVPNSGANNIFDLIDFSSHGPVNPSGGDGRWKPDICAPGTHIEAGIPQSNYSGSSVCNKYFPSGQTLYGWSSGTSHSTPAVAGGAALVRQWFLNQSLSAPSPAMTKAVLVNGTDYMTGAFANDTLPSNSQGMGRMDVANSFASVSRILVDQTQVLGASGATYVATGTIPDTSKPFRVSLCWTDAPGPTTGAPWVNNLDLTVTVGATTYKGNVFSGAGSVAGGSADAKNNAESVFLPAGTSGSFTVTVTAASIAGDGVPGNGDSTDQDFALLVWNGTAGGPAPPVANFSGAPLTGTKPLAVAFTDATTGSVTSWAWTFGDGGTSTLQSPSHTYVTAGSFTVALTATGPGGSNTNTKTSYITVSEPAPVADFSGAPLSGTKPLLVAFTDATTNPVTSWSWTFGDGGTSTAQNPSHTYSTAGTFTVALTATGPGGSNTKTKTSYITVGEPAPIADFSGSPLSGTKPLLVAFTDASTNPVTSWSWTFGDGGTSTAQNPSHTYATAGTFTVALTATGPGGSNTKTKTSYITVSEPAPVADFSGSPLSGTKPLLVAFTDTTSNPVTSWSWTFGDGGTSTTQNPSHTYATAGTFTVALTATGPGGSNTKTKTSYITVSEPVPIADFSGAPLSGTKPLLVAFTDATTNPVTSWSWTFGDGSTSTLQNPSHTFATAGTFTVALTATGPGGSNTKTKTSYITVSEPVPIADFSGSPLSGTKPLLVAFSDASTNPVTSWSWTFGDGGTSTLQNPSHTYATAGTFTVALTATGPGGSNTNTKTSYITVSEPAPIADFSGAPLSGTNPLLVAFTDATTNPVTSWSWTFGDGGTSTAQNPSHTYSTVGTFTVGLTATGPGGSNTNTKTSYITVSEPVPVASFSATPTSGTAPLAVTFSDLSSGPITGWAWDFGDGGTSTAQNPAHTYTTGGSFTVMLTVTGPGGSDTLSKPALISVSSGAFVSYGTGSGGASGVPLLSGAGDLTPGSGTGFTLSLSGAVPSAPTTLLVGLSSASLGLLGQTLYVFPIVVQVSLGSTNGAGTLTLPAAIAAGTPSLSIFAQAWVKDATGIGGWSSTNGLELQVP